MSATIKNIVVIGGSYVGISAAQQLAAVVPATHRVLLVEPHTHFHHLFTFPRFAVLPGHEHKAFVPYTGVWKQEDIVNPALHKVIRAKVLSILPKHVLLDRPWQASAEIPFDYVVVATGTRLTDPGNVPAGRGEEDKTSSVAFFQNHQKRVEHASDIVIIGGGAVGVQMATDIKELHPEKNVTVVHSREHLMPRFHPMFHDLLSGRFKELGVKTVLNTRVVIPEGGFPNNGATFDVGLNDGSSIKAQLVIHATGQLPNNDLVRSLPSTSPDSIVNPLNGYIRVRPTMQLADPAYPNMYAVGDIADTGAHKAARPGVGQAAVVAQNVAAMIAGKRSHAESSIDPAAIHMTLGMEKNIVFRNPGPSDTDPWFKWRDDGTPDMNVEGMWSRRGVRVNCADDYRL